MLALALAVAASLVTPAEQAGFEATPSYDETIAFVRTLERASPAIRLLFYGTSGAGRPMPAIVVSKDRAFTPAAAAKTGKPVALLVSGIHAGEIDGKDATLMLLRDMAEGRHRELLDAVILLVVPIYNVDGHERVSPFNRPNQDGPRRGMGFRTNAAGLDLNRDHLKTASPEARALVGLFNAWRPHLHVDNHVTDGCDFAWTLTYGLAEAPQAAPSVDAWQRAHLPAALAAVQREGFGVGPYVDLVDYQDPRRGMRSWGGPGRFSTGYFALRGRPTVLVETHSYKPYRERVAANRAFLQGLLAEVARDPRALLAAVREAEERTVALGRPGAAASRIVLKWDYDERPDTVRFPVYAWTPFDSVVTGKPNIAYERGAVREIEVPWYHRVTATVTAPRPRGYVVLPGWPQIEDRLRTQGLRVQRITRPVELEVETLRVADPKPAASSYQGLTSVTAQVTAQLERRAVPAGSLFIPADQPDFEVAVQLLEPGSTESLFSWGLLSSVTERKEYIDSRVLERLVRELLKDPQTAALWEKALLDPAFAADASARQLWWYRRTPHWDETQGLMPVYRVHRVPALTTEAWR